MGWLETLLAEGFDVDGVMHFLPSSLLEGATIISTNLLIRKEEDLERYVSAMGQKSLLPWS